MPDIVHVAVAVIMNDADEVCISLRHKDSHQGGLWEFPGGKVEQHETIEQALKREIREELNIDIEESRPLISIRHNYQDKRVCLHVAMVQSYQGQVSGVEGQQVEWVPVNCLTSYEFPAANYPIIRAVQLPDRYLITGKFDDEQDFLRKLGKALNDDIKLVQLRLKENDLKIDNVRTLIEKVSSLCEQAEARLLFNIPENYLQTIDLSSVMFDGYHADSKSLKSLSQRPAGQLFSASCHNEVELQKAIQLGADFVVLSPVKKTASHPEMQALGWRVFSSMLEICPMPVYALGGVSEQDMADAWIHGAQGIAAISAFWN
jgi:8-oxo-dGTP diphosphatase